jgi:arsenite methyltransferase
MPPLAKSAELASPPALGVLPASATDESESLFERFAWIYIFCREHVFRNDTPRIIKALWQDKTPPGQTRLLEIGCGPGFYSRKLARRFPEIEVAGIDNSKKQLEYARSQAAQCSLGNCKFVQGNVLDLAQPNNSFTNVIASRLFTVLPERERAVAEMFRVLRPGGKCLVAEPRFAFSASIPLMTMRVLARLNGYAGEYREPTRATALSAEEFRRLFRTQPWTRVQTWRVGRYQYALCEKS